MVRDVLKSLASASFLSIPLAFGVMAIPACSDEPFPAPVVPGYVEPTPRAISRTFLEDLATRTDEGYFSLFREEVIFYRDTDKPNAVIFLPPSDAAFSSLKLEHLFNGLLEQYDLRPFAATRENGVYSPLAEIARTDPASVHFLGLFYHGTPEALYLEASACSPECPSETFILDRSDEELCPFLDAALAPDAVIFLCSCSTGYGGEDAENFANLMMTCAPGRTVYAGTAPFQASGIQVIQWSPFEVTIMGGWGRPFGFWAVYPRTDITYTNLVEPERE